MGQHVFSFLSFFFFFFFDLLTRYEFLNIFHLAHSLRLEHPSLMLG